MWNQITTQIIQTCANVVEGKSNLNSQIKKALILITQTPFLIFPKIFILLKFGATTGEKKTNSLARLCLNRMQDMDTITGNCCKI